LLQTRHIRWLLDGDERAESLQTVVASLLTFWKECGEPHLMEEEQVLIPFVLQRRPLANKVLRRLEIDHEWLREKFKELSAMPHYENCVPVLRSMSDYMTNHVRLEEREIFPAIQEWLGEAALAELWEQSKVFRLRERGVDAIGPAGSVPEMDEPGADSTL
jgi:iron-sulfur cluster repair protein YtfE (RIC family)